MVLHYIASWCLQLAHPTGRSYQRSFQVTSMRLVDGVYICTERTIGR